MLVPKQAHRLRSDRNAAEVGQFVLSGTKICCRSTIYRAMNTLRHAVARKSGLLRAAQYLKITSNRAFERERLRAALQPFAIAGFIQRGGNALG